MMKNIFVNIAILAVLAGMCISCQDEMSEGQAGGGFVSQLKINATITDPATKVAYAESDSHDFIPSWEVGDKLLGFDSDGVTYGFEVSSVDDEGVAEIKIITTGDYAGTATADPADGTEMYMFYAPGAVKDSLHADKKEFTVSIKDQSSDIIPALMMAQGTVESGAVTLHFTNETSIIAIKTPKMATAGRKYTSISFFGTGVNTEVKFSVNGDGELTAEPAEPGRISKAIDVTTDAGGNVDDIIYIVSSPVSETAKFTFMTDNGEYLVKDDKTLAQGNYYYMTAPNFKSVPDDIIPGVFSIKDANGVISTIFFSKGNLYATHGSSNEVRYWGFESNQYDYRTYRQKPKCENGVISEKGTTSGHWGLFGWSTSGSASYYGRSTTGKTNAAYTGDFKDWGGIFGDDSPWRTLTREEWKWIIGPLSNNIHNQECRQSSTVNKVNNARFMKCTVGSTIGVLLFPDVFKWPVGDGAPEEASATNINVHTAPYSGITYTLDQFKTLESAGAVFLPAAGYRSGSGTIYRDGGLSDKDNTSNAFGLYWSSTKVTDTTKTDYQYKSWAMYFDEDNGVGEGDWLRSYGNFVRLVRVAE